MKLMEIKRFHIRQNTWYVRADFTPNQDWFPTSFFGPCSFEDVAVELMLLYPGYTAVETKGEHHKIHLLDPWGHSEAYLCISSK